MSEMVMRVARAMMMAAVTGDPTEEPHREPNAWELKYARIAVEAMREPSEAMLDAGWDRCDLGGDPLPQGDELDTDEGWLPAFYRAMIDAALNASP